MDLPGFSFDLSATLSQATPPDPGTEYDLLVVGGGPAAMTAVVYAARKTLRVAMLAKDVGGQMGWTSEIENYMGFQTITGQELTQKFREQVEQFDVPIALDQNVTKIEKRGESFVATLEDGQSFRGRTLIIATGKRDRPLNVPGEKEFVGKGVAYCATCDAPFYKEKTVVVAGGGNSAFTAALDLLKVGAAVTLVNFAPGWQADEVMRRSLDRFGDKATLLDEHQVVAVEGEARVNAVRVRNRKTGEERRLAVDGIFVEIGLLPNSEPLGELAELNAHNELIVDCHCRTSVPGLFGAGDVTTVPFKQIVISAGEGAKAALSAYDYLTQHGHL
ncbi:MAG TPA: FAD-dependent oxidoreductase [bacterium]|nr:FAD-dependent oxidoreductase [bacterium]